MSNKGDNRRLSGNMPLTYDRQQPFPEHAASGPSAPFSYYDRYGPEDPPSPGFIPPTEFNNNFWRPPPPPPDREFFPPGLGSQSPERFRPPQVDAWQRPPQWKEPEAAWQPDRPVQKPFTQPQWNRPQRDNTATRMFEPSDNWKQTHERYRPYSPPASANRNRFPPNNQRSDSYRPSFNDTDPWVPDENEPYESIARDHRAAIASTSTSSITPDRRIRGAEGEERSVSPVSPRITQQTSSPGYGSAVVATKRESPELPHLEALPRKPAVPVRVPGPTFPSRSPSHSSTNNPVNLPHVQAPAPVLGKAGLPPKPQFQTPIRSVPPGGAYLAARAQNRSPPLQISPATQVPSRSQPSPPLQISPATLGSSSGASTTGDVATQPAASQTKDAPAGASTYSNGRNHGRRPVIYNAPSFVPSTLAIDAALKYPSGVVSSENAKGSKQPTEDDAAGSDMDVSLPPTPAKALREESESIRSSRSPLPSDGAQASEAPGKEADDGATADESDMEMSPPPSPVLKPAPEAGEQTAKDSDHQKPEPSRPSLAIDTSVSSLQLPQQLPHEVPRQSSSASPVPSTPDHVADETAGDESDMDMSSPTSETAPSPPPEVPSVALAPLALPPTSLDPPLLSTATEFQSLPRDTAPPDTVVDPPPSDAAVTPVPPSPSVEPTAANTPDPQLPTPSATVSREVSVQLSPRITAVAKLARPHVEAGELSPPGSDKTLQGEAEIVEKDHDVRSQKDTAALMSQEVAMDVDQAPSDKVFAEIPLSDALRMVAKLRFRHDPVTQDARIEPILISNRQLAEPEPEPEQRQQPEQGQQQQQEVLEGSSVHPSQTFVPLTTDTEEKEQEYAGGHYDGTKHSLRKRFAQRQVALAEKVSRLRKEYLALHERWLVHCAKLDEIARASALEEVAATACRTTRRTTAMGDAVRSDLEMEQILASLGNEELTDANHLSAKNAAVIPDMVSVTKGRVEYIYDDTNNLVEDPHDFYKLDTGIDDWTEEEKIILLEKYAIHPKQFGIIAKFIPNKTPSQCVTFYYLHKNTTIDFRKVIAQFSTIGKRRRSGRGKQKGNALLADILKHDDEVGREGTPSSGRRKRGGPSSSTPVPPSASTDSIDETKRATGSVSTGSVSRRGTAQNTPDPTPTPDPEAAPSTSAKRPRRRANPSAKAAAAMDQDGAPEEAPEEDARPTKRTRKARKSKPEVDDEDDAPITPSDTKPAEQPDPPVRKRVPGSGSSWSAEDKALFLKLLAQYGDDFKRIASSMPNKTTIQVSAFYRANLTEMQLAKVAALAPKRSPTPHDNNHARLNSTIPGTGMMTSVMKRTNPGIDNGAATLSSRSSGRMSPPPNPSGTQSSETDKRATSAAPRNSAASSKSGLPSQPLSYQGGLAAAFAGPARSTFADPHTAQMTYPSAMAYANLGPSSFASSRAAALPRGINPARLPGATVPPVMDYSEFAPRPWQPPPVRQRPGQMHPSAVLGIGAPVTSGLPATLETTEDLVRYLEHRTRLSAGQTSDNDFML